MTPSGPFQPLLFCDSVICDFGMYDKSQNINDTLTVVSNVNIFIYFSIYHEYAFVYVNVYSISLKL